MNQKQAPQIRRATLADATLLAELGARTFSDTFAADNTPEDMVAYISSSFSPHLQGEELADPDTIFLIAEINGVAAGYAKLQSNAPPSCVTGLNSVEVCRLYVSTEMIGSGVGAALMEACIREAEKANYRTLWLGVWEQNERAQRFYKKWGFQVVGDHGFLLGGDMQRDLVMERSIGRG